MNPPSNESQTLLVTLSVSQLRELVREELERVIRGGNGDAERLLSVDELAETLGIKKSWLYGRTSRKDGQRIPHVKVGRYPRFRLSEVYSWLESKGDRGTFLRSQIATSKKGRG